MIYKCLICGYVHDEEATGIPLEDLESCPVCRQDISNFVEISESEALGEVSAGELSYPKEFAKSDESLRAMDMIHEMAVTGETIVSAMGTKLNMPNWDDILIMGCQLNPQPLEGDAEVNTQTVIGKNAEKPMVIETPVYITHMSFGALSRETKIALAKGSAAVATAQASGEGGDELWKETLERQMSAR